MKLQGSPFMNALVSCVGLNVAIRGAKIKIWFSAGQAETRRMEAKRITYDVKNILRSRAEMRAAVVRPLQSET